MAPCRSRFAGRERADRVVSLSSLPWARRRCRATIDRGRVNLSANQRRLLVCYPDLLDVPWEGVSDGAQPFHDASQMVLCRNQAQLERSGSVTLYVVARMLHRACLVLAGTG